MARVGGRGTKCRASREVLLFGMAVIKSHDQVARDEAADFIGGGPVSETSANCPSRNSIALRGGLGLPPPHAPSIESRHVR